MENIYTGEKNIQILISLLKKHNIKNIIASPGTTNISFVASVQSDNFFNVYSCVDERSAAYMACGMAAETQEPVVITCTGATASRNYLSALTEAYYRKLPIIAITATQHLARIGQNIAQVIDRTVQIKDTVKKSIQLTSVHTSEDRWACNLKVNDVLLECRRNGGGPVHINMVTTYSNDFSCKVLPDERKIERIIKSDKFPEITKKVAIFIGNHYIIDKKLESRIEEFCEKYNAVVICDHTSNYNGKYKILGNLIFNQKKNYDLKNIELLIDFGNISGAYMSINPKEVWRIDLDGELRDTFSKLKYVFEMDENTFFSEYNALKKEKVETTYYNEMVSVRNSLSEKLEKLELPFSNLWVAKQISSKLKDGDIVHLAILNTLRSWNYYSIDKNVKFYSNTGGFGIDGVMSSAIGNSLVTEKNVYCFIGDLAFFYDMNSIGNVELGKNLRILLINNGCGTEFHNYNHRAVAVATENQLDSKFFAADGHFGNKSKDLVKHYSEDLGFEYVSAVNKEEFVSNIDKFMDESTNKPMIFEIFTDAELESEELKKINNLEKDSKDKLKEIIGEKNIRRLKRFKKMLGR